MMAQISLRVDADVKKSAEQVCEDIGISMSAAINIYLKKLGRERRIPFALEVDPFYAKENVNTLQQRITDMNEGKNMGEHDLIEV